MYGDKPYAPNLVLVKVLSDIHSSLGNMYDAYNEFMSKTLPKVNTKQKDVNNIYPDCIISNTDKYDVKHTSTPTKHVSNADKSNIKYTKTSIKHLLPDHILLQLDFIQAHQQKVKILAEMEREVHLKQKKKIISNIHDIYNSDKSKTSKQN